MRPRLFHTFFLSVILAGSIGCASAEDRAGELYDTAQFEEKQTNFEHATHLYREILVDYPETSWADEARERLEAIEESK